MKKNLNLVNHNNGVLSFLFSLFFTLIKLERHRAMCKSSVFYSSPKSFISTRYLQSKKVAQLLVLLAVGYIFMTSTFIPQNVRQGMDAHEHSVYLCRSGTPFDVAMKTEISLFLFRIIFCFLYYSGSNHCYYSFSIYM